MVEKDNTLKLFFVICIITLVFVFFQLILNDLMNTDPLIGMTIFLYAVFSCILLGFLIIYSKSNNEKLKKQVYVFAENILHKYLKGRLALGLLILVYMTATVLVGWLCITILKNNISSEIHAGAFAGAFFGVLFATLIERLKHTIDNWNKMTPLKYLKRFFLFVIIGASAWILNDTLVLMIIREIIT